MKRVSTVLQFIVIVCLSCTSAKTPQNVAELQSAIQQKFDKTDGTFALAFKNLDAPEEELLINEHESFHAASTMKTPVMMEVYKQAEAGRFALDDSIPVKNDFKSIVDSSVYSLSADQDSYPELYEEVGEKRTIYNLTYQMIIASSNLATNIIIELVGAPQVTQSMRDLGANDIQVRRGVEDSKAFEQGLNNTTSAYDLMKLFEAIGRQQAVSAEASQAMLEILLDQQFNDIIPGQLPKEVKVAHKTGWITGIHHDSGIVLLPDGRKYVLVLLSKDLEDEDKAIETLASVSKIVYDYVNRQAAAS